jgi:hypothetical protein
MVRSGGGHELGGVAVGEELGQRFGPGWDVAVQDRVAAGCVGPVPLDEPLEEDPDHPEPLALSVLGQGRAAGSGLGGEPHLVVLDVAAGVVSDDGDVGVGDQPAGQLTQRAVGHVDAAGCEERGELQQVAAHRRGELRRMDRQLRPLSMRLGTRGPRLDDCFGSGHRLISWRASSSAAASASISSTARHTEEGLQVMCDGPQRVRPGPAGDQRKVGVDQRITQFEAGLTTARRGPDQAREAAHPRTIPAASEIHGDTR